VHYPGNVEVGTGIKKLGRTSITLGHGIYRDDGVLAAESASIIVLVDRAAGKSEPISDSIRAVLGADALAVKI
jgi:acyl-CoA thioester hydrolase